MARQAPCLFKPSGDTNYNTAEIKTIDSISVMGRGQDDSEI